MFFEKLLDNIHICQGVDEDLYTDGFLLQLTASSVHNGDLFTDVVSLAV